MTPAEHPLFAQLPPAPPEAVGMDHARCQNLLQRLRQDCDGGRIPGAVVLLARHGRTVMFEATGWRDPVQRLPMTLDALFRIYSMTKPVTSVAALMLMERGALLLSDALTQTLPAFKSMQVVDATAQGGLRPASGTIKLLDLLRHTCGFSYEFMSAGVVQRAYAQARIGSRDRSSAELADTLASLPLVADPDTVWEYSRATDVLGRVIEVISGQSLGTHLHEHIFAPLGMHDTSFAPPVAQHDRLAEAFGRDPDGGLQMRLFDARKRPALESGGGGLISTAADYARFAVCLLGQGSLDNVRLLAPATVRLMTSDHLGGRKPAQGMSQTLLPLGHGFGLGVAVRTSAGPAHEPGSVGSYFWGGMGGTTFFVDPALDLVAILMLQAPNQREYYHSLFRNLVYATITN